MFIAKVAVAEMRQRNNKDTSEQYTPKVNNTEPTNTKSTLYKKMLFKYALALPPHS